MHCGATEQTRSCHMTPASGPSVLSNRSVTQADTQQTQTHRHKHTRGSHTNDPGQSLSPLTLVCCDHLSNFSGLLCVWRVSPELISQDALQHSSHSVQSDVSILKNDPLPLFLHPHTNTQHVHTCPHDCAHTYLSDFLLSALNLSLLYDPRCFECVRVVFSPLLFHQRSG